MLGPFGSDEGGTEDFETARDRLVEGLRRRVDDERVLEAIRAVPRHEFVPEDRQASAYADRPLPIGADQTVSAPHMVAIMCEELDLEEGDEVLEIGTGCGYHAAVTAELVGDEHLYSVEYVQSLAADARETLADLGYDIEVRVGDGREGWPEHAPYDAVYLTCACAEIPDPLVEQLRVGGRLLAPVGTTHQTLVLGRKREDGSLAREQHGAVRFVRMQGE